MKTLLKTRTRLLLLLSVSLLTLYSCKKIKQEEPVLGDTKIRVVNTVVGSTPQDVYQNETKVSTTSVGYGQNTDYLTIQGGKSSTIALKNEGTQSISFSSVASPYANVSYTIFYYTNPNGFGAFAGFIDENLAVPTGKIKVRFMNLGSVLSNNINISVTDGGGPVTSGLAYGYLSAYNTVDPTSSLTVNVIGSTDTKVIPASTFQAGKIYTIWFDAITPTTVNYHVVAQN